MAHATLYSDSQQRGGIGKSARETQSDQKDNLRIGFGPNYNDQIFKVTVVFDIQIAIWFKKK